MLFFLCFKHFQFLCPGCLGDGGGGWQFQNGNCEVCGRDRVCTWRVGGRGPGPPLRSVYPSVYSCILLSCILSVTVLHSIQYTIQYSLVYPVTGKHNGTVKGVKYFKCKDKHGVFVKKDKLIQSPSGSSSSSSPRLSHGTHKSPSPAARRKPTSHPTKPYTPLSSGSSSRSSALSHRRGLGGRRT